MLMYPFIFASCGFIFIFYAMYVENKAKKDPNYRAFCDFTPNISCTRGVNARWESLLGMPNTLMSVFYYFLVMVLAYFDMSQFVFYLGVMGVLMGFTTLTLMISQEKIFCTICATGTLWSILIAYFAFIG